MGSGTRLVYSSTDSKKPPTLILKKGKRELPLEQLTQYGVTDLDIPWERLTLDTTQSFEAQEQQIIVLGEGDQLDTLEGLDAVIVPIDGGSKLISTLKYAAQQVSSAT